MLLLKDRGLVECLAKPEWAQKVPEKLRERDWALMENIVGVLKVRFGAGSEMNGNCTGFCICVLQNYLRRFSTR